MQRDVSFADRILGEIDCALRTIASAPRARRTPPTSAAAPISDAPASKREPSLSEQDTAESVRLMRVNHAGEIAAQALYRGQALVSRDRELRAELLQAASEENDHLAWCADRAKALGGRVSWLTPLWYGGSFAIGTIAGLAGDKQSLGFVAETERQVAKHLDEHLERLPSADTESRAILEQMRSDEIEHGKRAAENGAAELRKPVKTAMRLASAVMTKTAYWL